MSTSIQIFDAGIASVSNAIVSAFEAQVCRTPNAVAVICGEQSLTYAALNSRANDLAAKLRNDGFGPGRYIGLGFERSLEMMVALWAVVKSGAAYIPVDPAYPDSRIAHMASSARWAALLTQSSLAARFKAIANAGPVVLVDTMGSGGDVPNPVSQTKPADPLYAIFTSGSTGEPKAASVYHSGFANLLQWYGSAFELDPACRALVLTSLSFDLTQKNLFAPLLAGGVVVLQPPGPYDLAAIGKQITTHGVTLVNTTPSAFYPLVDAAASKDYVPLSTLRAAVLGGEPISIPRLRSWLEASSTRAFVANTYGPTECTDICAWYRLDRNNLEAYPFVPVGRPIPNVGIVILDENLHPVPDNETGELCIAGAGVGAGYLHDSARTAERFIKNPCPESVPGPLLYRTGDLARIDAEGVIEFRGRMDHQVKVRGFRVELGEIELALAAHPAVRQAVVTAAHGGGESARLTAWLLPNDSPCESEALRSHLAARVPAYMVPQRFHWLDAYPMTPNGKVDRLALQRHDQEIEQKTALSISVPAGTGWEARLLALWSEVLARPITDPTVNFFDIGGNSLQLAIVHARIQEMSGREILITDLFSHPTVRSLATHLGGRDGSADRRAMMDRVRRQQEAFARVKRPLRS